MSSPAVSMRRAGVILVVLSCSAGVSTAQESAPRGPGGAAQPGPGAAPGAEQGASSGDRGSDGEGEPGGRRDRRGFEDDLPSFGESLLRVTIVLLAIVAALLLVSKLLPRWIGHRAVPGRGRLIHVVDSVPIAPRRTLHVVRVAGEFFLIGSSESGLELLAGGRLDPERLARELESRGHASDGAVQRSEG